jgi:two-component system CheB/CheR fusion protein
MRKSPSKKPGKASTKRSSAQKPPATLAPGQSAFSALKEELNTVNQQLLTKVNELETANNNLNNVLASNEVATLCLDRDLHIKWFSPAARNALGLIASDVGRPVSVFASALMGKPLIRETRIVLEKLAPVQTEVEGEGGLWYLRRTLPYRMEDKRVDGVIVTFTDISSAKHAAQAVVDAGLAAAEDLKERVEERTRQLRALAFELTRAEEMERQAIAQDLHDGLGQLLAVAKLKLERIKSFGASAHSEPALAEVEELIGRAEASVRSLAFQLSPAVLYELGLMPALQWLAEEVKKTYGLSVNVSDDELPKPLSQAARSVVFRAIRELLINVVKHAGVSAAYVGARRVGDEIEFEVNDDGNGFAPDDIRARTRRGFGLTSVRERLSFIGGHVEISSEPGNGTEIRLTVPVSQEQASDEPPGARRS